MSLNNINWHGEALEFAKVNDQNRDSSVAIIEKAMRKGADLAVIETIALISIVGADLKAKIKASEPHKGLTRTINIETP